MTAPIPLHPRSHPRSRGVLVLGILVTLVAALNGVPLLLSLAFDGETALWGRLANVALFGLPVALVLYAGVTMIRSATGAIDAEVWPTSRLGRVAGWLAVGATAVVATLPAYVALVGPGDVPEPGWDTIWAFAPLVLAWTAALAATTTGGVALLRRRDRSAVVLAVIGVGFAITAFGLGEALLPH